MPESLVVGIDVAKQTFDASIGVGGSIETFANDDGGHDTLLAKLTGRAIDLIVMEATGAWSAIWPARWRPPVLLWPSSILARRGTLPRPWAISPRRIASTPRRWRNWPKCFP